MSRNRAAHLTILPDMKNGQIEEKIKLAKKFFSTNEFSDIKKDILAKLFEYATQNFIGLVARSPDRYVIYNNILQQATKLDDVHFLYFTRKQIRTISSYSSSLRSTVLPHANNYLEIALAPTVARMQKAFLGMITAGTLMLLSRYAPGGTMLICAGMTGYVASSMIVEYRLDRSLALTQNRLLMGGVDSTRLINDGLQDEYTRIENIGYNALNSGLSLLSRASNQLGRIAGNPQPQLQAAARVEVMEKDTDNDQVANRSVLR